MKRAFDWLFRNRRTNRITIVQFPNVPLWIFIVASVVRRFGHPHGTFGTIVGVVAAGSLLFWAGDEIVRGVNPFRRILGAVVLVATVIALVAR
jgi:hypothetical protein